MCPQLLLTMAARTLTLLLEELGFLAPRLACRVCGTLPGNDNIRVKVRIEEWTGPGGHIIQHPVEHAAWQCPRGCSWEPSVMNGQTVLVSGYSLRQNASLLYHWARMQEMSVDELAETILVDHGKLVDV